ncbi:DNA polymerase III subunit delta [Halocynthiibacter sp. C4]|uniref:DNA polymerase III subunit delta n=1 Tax=Halocynthiibacter sp. C4 TaxID=2992758 RepID=UPI00237AF397|nr:DNA polymerase III subunit delta [Halocynthiibacter sp. C4]MDE0591071.1 DNA polymerase III subunit delta [Halocynthiibacter sp. C4]
MKLSTRDAASYFAKPDPRRTGILIYGPDSMRVALKRQQVIAALIGPNGDDEMRLTRIPAADLRQDSAMLLDAIKAQGFFPGPRVAFVEGATDTLSKFIKPALDEWQDGDAQIVVTAGQLTARSALRKLFEAHNNAYAAGIFTDPPNRAEIEADLANAGLSQVDRDALDALTSLAQELGPGDLRQTIEKLALYTMGNSAPVSAEDVTACAPTSTEAALDDVLNIVAEGRQAEIGPIMRKLEAQGTQPVGLCIGALRHFRALHAACSHPNGASEGIGRLRPPVFGPRRDRMLRQAQRWGRPKLEAAITMLIDTDLQLRSTSRAPSMALIERTLIRVAMYGARR